MSVKVESTFKPFRPVDPAVDPSLSLVSPIFLVQRVLGRSPWPTLVLAVPPLLNFLGFVVLLLMFCQEASCRSGMEYPLSVPVVEVQVASSPSVLLYDERQRD